MKSRLILLTLLFAQSGYAQNQSRKLAANAGTGPYSSAVQSGLTASAPLSAAQHQLFSAISFVRDNNRVKASEAFEKFLSQVGQNVRQDSQLQQAFRIEQQQINTVRLYLSPEKYDQQRALETLTVIYVIVREHNYDRERRALLTTFNSGFFFRENGTYDFQNLIVSLGEYGKGRSTSEAFLTGGLFVPLSTSNAKASGRIGAGVAFGDPYRVVGSLTGASYLSPRALDAAGSVSVLLNPRDLRPKGLQPLPQAVLDALYTFGLIQDATRIHYVTRTVVDRIRPDDRWLTLGARQISTTDRRILPNGTIGEAEFTYAFDSRHKGTYAATTLSLSGIYCANKDLGVDELGAEFRTPVFTRALLSARYGTRGHYTLSLAFRL